MVYVDYLYEFIKRQFVIESMPNISEIVVSKKKYQLISALLTVAVFLFPFSLMLSIYLSIYRVLFMNGLKIGVGEFVFLGLWRVL